MAIDEPGLPSTPPGGVGVPASRPSPDRPLALVEKPKRLPRPALDPFDLEGAIARLAQLLALDAETPRFNVPRGFYLNILV
ncbi:MAG: hypothetical protein GKS00_02555 [Alphaproteobacteria bacterium]|nr:hypothetical protein [Alphaproteobacteria bacterium]